MEGDVKSVKAIKGYRLKIIKNVMYNTERKDLIKISLQVT